MNPINPFIYEICQYLASQSSGMFNFNTPDANLRIGEQIIGGLGVFAVEEPTQEPDKYTPLEYRTVTFWTSHQDSAQAQKYMQMIYSIFYQAHHYQTPSYYIYFSHPLMQPVDSGRDMEGRRLLRLSIRYIEANLIS